MNYLQTKKKHVVLAQGSIITGSLFSEKSNFSYSVRCQKKKKMVLFNDDLGEEMYQEFSRCAKKRKHLVVVKFKANRPCIVKKLRTLSEEWGYQHRQLTGYTLKIITQPAPEMTGPEL